MRITSELLSTYVCFPSPWLAMRVWGLQHALSEKQWYQWTPCYDKATMLTFLLLWPMPDVALSSSLNSASLSPILKSQSFVNNPVLLDVDSSRGRIFISRRLQTFSFNISARRKIPNAYSLKVAFNFLFCIRPARFGFFPWHSSWHSASPSMDLGNDLQKFQSLFWKITIHLPISFSEKLAWWGKNQPGIVIFSEPPYAERWKLPLTCHQIIRSLIPSFDYSGTFRTSCLNQPCWGETWGREQKGSKLFRRLCAHGSITVLIWCYLIKGETLENTTQLLVNKTRSSTTI